MKRIINLLLVCVLIFSFAGCKPKVEKSRLTNKTYSFAINYPAALRLQKFGDNSFALFRGTNQIVKGDIYDIAYTVPPQGKKIYDKVVGSDFCKDPYILNLAFTKAIDYSFPEGIGDTWRFINGDFVDETRIEDGGIVWKFYLIGTPADGSNEVRVGPYYNICFKSKDQPLAFVLLYNKKTLASGDDDDMMDDIADSFTKF